MSSQPGLQAAWLTGTLWAAICTAGGPCPASRQHQHFPAAFDPAWLDRLPLPTDSSRPPGQPVSLLDDDPGRRTFERHTSEQDITAAYDARPRTRVYVDIGYQASHTWYALTARHLGRLARCLLEVRCSVFTSQSGDESLGTHWDSWYGAIVQVSGAKQWMIGEAPASPDARQVTTRAGDILLIPKYLPHTVTTPRDPGHSIHLAFVIDRDPAPRTREETAQLAMEDGSHA